MVEGLFGPHTVDLMAIDSNVMLDREGKSLRHFTPFPSVGSSGVNVFSQNLSAEGNPYVFPPFNLIFPLLKFFEESKLQGVTMVLPDLDPRPVWWPFFRSRLVHSKTLCQKGEVGVLFFPTKAGYQINHRGLKWSLLVARLCFKG